MFNFPTFPSAYPSTTQAQLEPAWDRYRIEPKIEEELVSTKHKTIPPPPPQCLTVDKYQLPSKKENRHGLRYSSQLRKTQLLLVGCYASPPFCNRKLLTDLSLSPESCLPKGNGV